MVLMRLFQTSRRFQVEIQPQLVLLQKTLLNIEGLGRELDPNWICGIRPSRFLRMDAEPAGPEEADGPIAQGRRRRAMPS
jgi:hypothetical protein